MLELLVQDPSLLGRQFAQGFLAFTQAQPLQEPVLLHLQHGMVQLSLSLSPCCQDQLWPARFAMSACSTSSCPQAPSPQSPRPIC